MTRILRALLPAAALFLLAALPAYSQDFGKNKVQYRNFDWSVIRTTHFDVYFYGEERQTAMDAARMAERSYSYLSRVLNHDIEHHVPVILYASHTDFQQTNITDELIDEGTGGITEMLKQRVFLPFTGSYAELEHVLTHEMTHAFEMDIVYGDGLGFMANPLGFQPPTWLMEGLAEYTSLHGVDVQTKMWLRDAALEGYLIPISTLNFTRDIRVYRFGQSICDFIARHYGEEKLGDLLRRAPDSHDMDTAFRDVLGISSEKLSDLWMEEVRRTYLPEIASHQKPSDFATRLTEQGDDFSRLNLAPAVSPRGDRVAFISDRSLYQDIYIGSAIDGKVLERLIKGERTGDMESLRFLTTSLSWSPDESRIAFVAKVGARDVIYLVEVARKKIVKEIHVDLDGVVSPAFSPDGKRLAFVGLQGGQSDLFVCDVDGSNVQRLTHDRYTDRDPAWSPDGKQIAFTTDRGTGTDFDKLVFADFRVAVLNLDDQSVTVLPDQEGKNWNPCWSPDGKWVAFISDRTGIDNIFAVDLGAGKTWQLTNVLSGICGITTGTPTISWSHGGDRMVFCAYTKGGYDLYAVKNPLDLKKPYVAPVAAAPVEAAAPASPAATPGAPHDSATVAIKTSGADSAAIQVAQITPPTPATPPPGTPPPAAADTLAVTLPTSTPAPAPAHVAPPRVTVAAADSTAHAAPPPIETAALPDTSSFKVLPYKTTFSRDYTVGGAAFASNVGFAGQTALSFSDVLGNHNIFFAASVFGSITDSDLLFSYTNRKYRTNWGAALFQYRNDYLVQTASQANDYQSNIYRGAELAFSRPFSKFVRVEWALQAVSVSQSVYESWYYGVPTNLQNVGTLYFVSPSVALVRDDVVFGYDGPLSGTRARWDLYHSWGDLSSTTAIMDWRHYANLHHRYVFALRGISALSDGRDPEIFRVGGPFTFRGSDWGELVGSRVAITNTEFRFPLIDRLQLVWPLSLDFRGIQGVLFFDTAAAWSDGHIRIFRDGHLDSALAAYGFGARLNLGIVNLRYDVAQATDLERRVGNVRQFFTIGYDF